MQNFIELSAAVILRTEKKINSAENITVRRYGADSNNNFRTHCHIHVHLDCKMRRQQNVV